MATGGTVTVKRIERIERIVYADTETPGLLVWFTDGYVAASRTDLLGGIDVRGLDGCAVEVTTDNRGRVTALNPLRHRGGDTSGEHT